jgi:succinylglutamic semialdehyde dehydrogenase
MTNKILINGEWRDGAGAEFSSFDPSTGEEIWKGASATKADVNEAVQAARGAFEKWALTPLVERIAVMERYRDIIKRDGEELARLISRETGKPFWETKTEAAAVAGKIDISIRAYHERTGEKETASGATRGILRHKPHGVMAVLGPYNFPAHLANGHIVPALIAGNTAVFKPSEMTPGPGAFIVERMMEAGVPAGVVNMVQGARETGQALTGAEVDGVLFTGGAKTGLAIHKQFADRLDIILALELGGNNPLIWWDTDDVDAAAFVVVQSAFLTSGQRCTCARRLILPEGAAGDKAIDALAKLTDRLIIGAPFDDPQPFMGPVISPKIAEGLERAFDQLVEQEGEAIRNLSVREEGSAFVTPGIVDVTRASAVPDEEHFGPLLKIWRVKNFDDAITCANATSFGLSAGILTDDQSKWERFLALSRAGIVNWNRQTTGASGAAPFGGIGASGNHRPSAYYAADYCSYPVASMEGEALFPMADGQVGVKGQ